MNKKIVLGCLCVGVLLAAGCVTVGRTFKEDYVSKIVIGQTTRAEIEQQLGVPFRTGVDSGDLTATYMYYHLGLFSRPVTTDLKITYSSQNKVKAYVFDSNAGGQEQEADEGAEEGEKAEPIKVRN
ncbi:hypothetical protein JW933_09960 [candidate division FCPU426 bacterium]|nr:hypothetical protein [candidate division FCPU426 bacterium]